MILYTSAASLRGEESINIHATFQAKRAVCRRGHLKARQLAVTELRKPIFQRRLNASSSDQTQVWSITQRTFEPVNVTRRLISSGAENGAWRRGINATEEGWREKMYIYSRRPTHLSVTHTPVWEPSRGASPHLYHATAVTDPVTLFPFSKLLLQQRRHYVKK